MQCCTDVNVQIMFWYFFFYFLNLIFCTKDSSLLFLSRNEGSLWPEATMPFDAEYEVWLVSLVHFSRFQNIAVGRTCHENKCMCPEKSHLDLLSFSRKNVGDNFYEWSSVDVSPFWMCQGAHTSAARIMSSDCRLDGYQYHVMQWYNFSFIRKHFWRWSAFLAQAINIHLFYIISLLDLCERIIDP